MDVVAVGPEDEELLLDLLNTTPVVDGVPQDTLADRRQARAWMRERRIAPTDAQLMSLIDVRSVLQRVVRGDETPTALRRFLTAVTMSPVAAGGGLDWRLVANGGSGGAVRAVLGWDALRISSPGRLRPCANAECRLFLIDRSRPNNARWCSMAICGNRMKARRHYRRTKGSEPQRNS
ncbi:MAG: hypothetical protein QOD39_5347 [Mycobacterium sp.]|nr:hypothetical protein [Mycobacterium sp.]